MKFISKSTNLNIILRPGIPAQPITGTPATPTISVRFQGGVAEVEKTELVEMMLKHPGFNRDFISAEDISPDPYAYLREPAEPAHVLTEMVYGHPEKRSTSPIKKALPPEIKKLFQAEAAELAKAIAEPMAQKIAEEKMKTLLPGMVAEALKQLVSANEEAKHSAPNTLKKSPGKPKKTEIVEEGASAQPLE